MITLDAKNMNVADLTALLRDIDSRLSGIEDAMADRTVTMAEQLGDERDRDVKIYAEALSTAVYLNNGLGAALYVPPPPDWHDDRDAMITPADADNLNERNRAIERATVGRVLRIAGEFADFIRSGISNRELMEAELRMALGDDGDGVTAP